MSYSEPTTDEIMSILREVKTIAVVGASDNPARPSYMVMQFLKNRGYRIIPINPSLAGQQLMGERVYSNLTEVPEPVDMVDIFRNSEAAMEVTEDAIKIGAKVVWMQIGVINEKAAELALSAGLKVVMNRCPKIELSKQAD